MHRIENFSIHFLLRYRFEEKTRSDVPVYYLSKNGYKSTNKNGINLRSVKLFDKNCKNILQIKFNSIRK